jgi:hypothetical protein
VHAPLLEFLRQLTESAPVVLLVAPERQAETIRLIAEGKVEFVARLPAMDMQRRQTVVELAVRLRETIRRLSDAWETRAQSARAIG